jgi:hypothetical protein
LYIRSSCRRKGVYFSDHPQSVATKGKPVILTTADHKHAVAEALGILKGVNDSVAIDGGPFVLVGDPEAEHLKSFWYKVRCKLCGDLF